MHFLEPSFLRSRRHKDTSNSIHKGEGWDVPSNIAKEKKIAKDKILWMLTMDLTES